LIVEVRVDSLRLFSLTQTGILESGGAHSSSMSLLVELALGSIDKASKGGRCELASHAQQFVECCAARVGVLCRVSIVVVFGSGGGGCRRTTNKTVLRCDRIDDVALQESTRV
jgi:hypothetical protein